MKLVLYFRNLELTKIAAGGKEMPPAADFLVQENFTNSPRQRLYKRSTRQHTGRFQKAAGALRYRTEDVKPSDV